MSSASRSALTALGLTYRAYQPTVGRELSLTVVSPEQLANNTTFVRRFQASPDVAEHACDAQPRRGRRPLAGTWRHLRRDSAHQGGSLESCLQQGPFTLDDAVAFVVT